jgi:hypothetical protein
MIIKVKGMFLVKGELSVVALLLGIIIPPLILGRVQLKLELWINQRRVTHLTPLLSRLVNESALTAFERGIVGRGHKVL